jgi:thymidylate kinase
MPVFVVIEGIPDIGKSHLVNALSNRLTNMKKKVLRINEFAYDEYEIIFLRAIEKDAMSEISITLLSIINRLVAN